MEVHSNNLTSYQSLLFNQNIFYLFKEFDNCTVDQHNISPDSCDRGPIHLEGKSLVICSRIREYIFYI